MCNVKNVYYINANAHSIESGATKSALQARRALKGRKSERRDVYVMFRSGTGEFLNLRNRSNTLSHHPAKSVQFKNTF